MERPFPFGLACIDTGRREALALGKLEVRCRDQETASLAPTRHDDSFQIGQRPRSRAAPSISPDDSRRGFATN